MTARRLIATSIDKDTLVGYNDLKDACPAPNPVSINLSMNLEPSTP